MASTNSRITCFVRHLLLLFSGLNAARRDEAHGIEGPNAIHACTYIKHGYIVPKYVQPRHFILHEFQIYSQMA